MPSLSPRALPGMLKATQCVQVPRGASGSSQISAKLSVPSGGSDHFNSGDKSGPSTVCREGIVFPSANAELLSSRVIVCPPYHAASRPNHVNLVFLRRSRLFSGTMEQFPYLIVGRLGKVFVPDADGVERLRRMRANCFVRLGTGLRAGPGGTDRHPAH